MINRIALTGMLLVPVLLVCSPAVPEDMEKYDPTWLPPPVGVTGDIKTYDRNKKDSIQKKEPAGTDEKPRSTWPHITTMEELRILINKRLAETFVYPERAKSRGIEGTVNLTVDISVLGRLIAFSDDGKAPPLLVQAAEQQIESIFPLQVILDEPVYGFSIQIIYTLK